MSLDTAFYRSQMAEAEQDRVNVIVGSAVIYDDSRVLIVRRNEEDYLGGKWEIPGGKASGKWESPDRTVIREVKEETNLDVRKILQFLGYFDYSSDPLPKKNGFRLKFRQLNYLVAVNGLKSLRLVDHDRHAWLAEGEMDKYDFTGPQLKNILTHFLVTNSLRYKNPEPTI